MLDSAVSPSPPGASARARCASRLALLDLRQEVRAFFLAQVLPAADDEEGVGGDEDRDKDEDDVFDDDEGIDPSQHVGDDPNSNSEPDYKIHVHHHFTKLSVRDKKKVTAVYFVS